MQTPSGALLDISLRNLPETATFVGCMHPANFEEIGSEIRPRGCALCVYLVCHAVECLWYTHTRASVFLCSFVSPRYGIYHIHGNSAQDLEGCRASHALLHCSLRVHEVPSIVIYSRRRGEKNCVQAPRSQSESEEHALLILLLRTNTVPDCTVLKLCTVDAEG